MKAIRQFFMYFTNLSVRYNNIASDPEKKETSAYFGVRSILSSLLGAIIVVLCSFGISALMPNDNIVSLVFIVILAVCILGTLFECTLRALMTLIYQLRLNKKPISWIALAVFLISFILMVALSVLMVAGIL